MKHLPREHPHVQRVMEFILMEVREKRVHEKLLCNFDQVWSCLFEPMRRTLWKSGGASGAKDDLSKYPTVRLSELQCRNSLARLSKSLRMSRTPSGEPSWLTFLELEGSTQSPAGGPHFRSCNETFSNRLQRIAGEDL